METIYKYLLSSGNTTLELSVGAKVLDIAKQGDDIYLWAIVNPEATVFKKRHFVALITGERFDALTATYIKTLHLDNGAYVLHFFEVA